MSPPHSRFSGGGTRYRLATLTTLATVKLHRCDCDDLTIFRCVHAMRSGKTRASTVNRQPRLRDSLTGTRRHTTARPLNSPNRDPKG